MHGAPGEQVRKEAADDDSSKVEAAYLREDAITMPRVVITLEIASRRTSLGGGREP